MIFKDIMDLETENSERQYSGYYIGENDGHTVDNYTINQP